MINGVGYRGANASDPDLADAFRAELVHVRVDFVDHDDLDVRNVGVDRDVIVLQRSLHDATGARITLGVLGEREADPPNDATEKLTLCSLGI